MAVCRSSIPVSGPRAQRKGFVLIATSIAMTLLIAMAGLAIDIGRMYVIRAELQSFTDAAALSAARELDGTDAGVARARVSANQLAAGPHAMRWDMGTQPIANIAANFSNGSRTVRVVATEPAPVIFLRLFQSADSTTIAAQSVASKSEQTARLIQ